jgi:hypothetical protein
MPYLKDNSPFAFTLFTRDKMGLLVLFFICTSSIVGQSIDKNNLKNTDWKYTTYITKDTIINNPSEIFYSFKDSLFYWFKTTDNLLRVEKDTHVILSGFWIIDSNQLVFKIHYESFYWNEYPIKTWNSKVLYTTNDSLVITYFENSSIKLVFTKVPKLQNSIPNLRKYVNYVQPQLKLFYQLPKKDLMLNYKNGKKNYRISIDEPLTIRTYADLNSNMSTKYVGRLITCDSQSVYLRLDSRNQSWDDLSKVSNSTNIDFTNNLDTVAFPYLKELILDKIPYQNIYSLEQYKSSKLNDFAVFATSVSFISSLIIAPLSSYNFKTGNFNQKLYYKILVPSLITASICIPLTFISGSKTYKYFNNRELDLKFKPIN